MATLWVAIVVMGTVSCIFSISTESGDRVLLPLHPAESGNDQPVKIIGALIVDAANLEARTQGFFDLISTF